jgi:hypothetical protein
MYAVELDQSKRLLVITAAQRVTTHEARLAAQRVRELVQDVAPGFRVLADFRWLDSMDSGAPRHIAEIMDALAEKKVAAVTRVMPDPHKDIGLNILSHFHYGPEIKIATFDTLADALQSVAANADSSQSSTSLDHGITLNPIADDS